MWPFQNYATKRHLPCYSICSHYTVVCRQLPCGKLLSFLSVGMWSVPAALSCTVKHIWITREVPWQVLILCLILTNIAFMLGKLYPLQIWFSMFKYHCIIIQYGHKQVAYISPQQKFISAGHASPSLGDVKIFFTLEQSLHFLLVSSSYEKALEIALILNRLFPSFSMKLCIAFLNFACLSSCLERLCNYILKG